jgi:hypothetical protein
MAFIDFVSFPRYISVIQNRNMFGNVVSGTVVVFTVMQLADFVVTNGR